MDADNSLVVEYRLSTADLFRFNLAYCQYYWRMGWVAVLILGAAFPRIAQVYHGQATEHQKWVLWTGLLMLFGIIGVVACLIAVYYWWDAYQGEQKFTKAGASRLEISPACLQYTDEQAESRVKWSAISRVRGSREFLCLYMETIPVYIIPRRSFASAQEAEAFLQAARTWQAAAAA